jgi:DNA-binding response OmpR family regulator
MELMEPIRHSFTRREPPPRSFAPVSPGRGMVGPKLLILVVERDPHTRELEAHYLNGAGFAVEFALDGNAALAQARVLRPDLVITEILVPHLDGLALCRRLKASPETADISVLVFSILASRTRALEAGADAFLMKPLAEHRLLTTVQALLENRVLGRQEAQA